MTRISVILTVLSTSLAFLASHATPLNTNEPILAARTPPTKIKGSVDTEPRPGPGSASFILNEDPWKAILPPDYGEYEDFYLYDKEFELLAVPEHGETGIHTDDVDKSVTLYVGIEMVSVQTATQALVQGKEIKIYVPTEQTPIKRRMSALTGRLWTDKTTEPTTVEDLNTVSIPFKQAELDKWILLREQTGALAKAKGYRAMITTSPGVINVDRRRSTTTTIQPILIPARLPRQPGWLQPKHVNIQDTVRLVYVGESGKSRSFNWRTVNIVDASDTTPWKLPERRNVVSAISTTESHVVSNKSEATDIQLIYNALQTVRGNISDAILPYLKEMTNNTNSSLVYHAAWSIWSDLTGANQYNAGPFQYGMHCLDGIEDQYAKEHNLTESDPAFQNLLAVNGILIDMYAWAWANSYAAVNASGLLGKLSQITSYLAIHNDTSLQSSVYDDDDSYFAMYDESLAG